MSYIVLLEQTPIGALASVNLGMSYTALLEQTPGVPQGTQASRLLCIYLLYVTQMMMVSMVMIQVQYADRLCLCGQCGGDISKAVFCNFGSVVL